MLQSPGPIIVTIPDSNEDPTGLAHVITQALGITGVLTVLALVCGALLAGVMFWLRARQR